MRHGDYYLAWLFLFSRFIKATFLFLLFTSMSFFPPFDSPAPMHSMEYSINELILNYATVSNISTCVAFQLSLIVLSLIFILVRLCCATYVNELERDCWCWLSFLIILLIASENPFDINIAMFFHFYVVTTLKHDFSMSIKNCKTVSFFISFACYFMITSVSVSPKSHILSIFLTNNMCYMIARNKPFWVPFLLILLSNDIELNPGDHYQNNFFTFMNWNLNSLAKNNFERIKLIEAHNSLFNYDIISLCETSLNSEIVIPDPLMNEYTFIPANHPNNESHGGVGLFYKNSLPLKARPELSFDETIVVELKFGRKKIFFTVLYRSPSFHHSSLEFQNFMNNFEKLYDDIKKENPYATFFAGDFNGHSQLWWADGDTTPEGKKLEEMISNLNLSQVISEPTNFTPNKNPSCIDLLITDQPNLILDSGTRPSLDSKCHHQIIYGKINFKIPPPPPSERKIWHYNQANTDAIKRSMSAFPWAQHLNLNTNPNWQVKTFHETFLIGQ